MHRVTMFKSLAVMLVVAGVLFALPAVAYCQEGDWGFVPNSGEASVSKVDLETGAAVARYYTAPRLGQMVDQTGAPSATPNTVPPYAWRTSRIATDPAGNVWVLNVGADAFLTSYPSDPPANFSSYAYPGTVTSPSRFLVGSVVRIQAATQGLGSTSTDHGAPLPFGTDQAVQVFPVGAAGDMPRAIAVDPGGGIWIGFYNTGVFQKYAYDPVIRSLAPVGDPVPTQGRPYEAKIDSNGVLWFSSRPNANPNRPGSAGVGSFDTTAANPSVTFYTIPTPYSLAIGGSPGGVVYVTNYTGTLYKIDGGLVSTVAISGASQLRGMAFDATGKLWMASSGNGSVSWYDPVGGGSGTVSIGSGTVPVGVGIDATGMLWVVCRNDGQATGFIAKFDPATVAGPADFTRTAVGYRPYAYGDFVIPGGCPPTEGPQSLCMSMPVSVKVHPTIWMGTSVDVLEYDCANPLTNNQVRLAFDWTIKSNVPWWKRIEWTGLALGTYDEQTSTWITQPGSGYLFESFAPGSVGLPAGTEEVYLADSVDVGRVGVSVDGAPVSNPWWSQVIGDANDHEDTERVGYEVDFTFCDTAGWYGGYIWLCAFQN